MFLCECENVSNKPTAILNHVAEEEWGYPTEHLGTPWIWAFLGKAGCMDQGALFGSQGSYGLGVIQDRCAELMQCLTNKCGCIQLNSGVVYSLQFPQTTD